MARLFLVVLLAAAVLFAGCSKKEEDVKAIGQEAAQDDAAAVMDSLNNEGTESGQQEQGTLAEDTPTVAQVEEQTSEAEVDYSNLTGYVVQIGSYSDYDFAKMMADKYVARDYPAFVVKADVDGTTYYRLRIGVYETIDEAKEIGELLKDRYSATYWIDNN